MPIISVRDKIKIVDQRETNKKKRQKRTIGKQVIVRELNDSVWPLS